MIRSLENLRWIFSLEKENSFFQNKIFRTAFCSFVNSNLCRLHFFRWTYSNVLLLHLISIMIQYPYTIANPFNVAFDLIDKDLFTVKYVGQDIDTPDDTLGM